MVGATTIDKWQAYSLQGRLHMLPNNGNISTITPFDIYMGNCPLAFSTQSCILQLFQAYHSESVCGQVYRYSPNLSITRVTQAPICSLQRITSTRWFVTSYMKSVNAYLQDTTFPFERINHARFGMIYQASHQGLQHPLKRIFPSATVIEYINLITSSTLFQESTHLGVASVLCSSLGTTTYFSMSLPLLVSRVRVAIHL